MTMLMSISMSNADIVIYLFLFLFLIIGFAKGFAKMLISLLKSFAAVGAAYFLCNPFAAFLSETKVYSFIYSKVTSIFEGKSEIFSAVVDPSSFDSQLEAASAELNIPSFLNNFVFGSIDVGQVPSGTTIGALVGNSLTNIVIVAMAFAIIFIVVGIFIAIIGRMFITMIENSGFRLFDRLLGAIASAATGLIVIFGVLIIINLIGILIPNVNIWLQSQIYYEGYTGENFSIAVMIYENNPFNSLLVTPAA